MYNHDTDSDVFSKLLKRFLPVALPLLAAAGAAAQSLPSATPGGYEVGTYFNGFQSPLTAICLDPVNRVLAATIDGEIHALVDTNNDGAVDTTSLFFNGAANGALVSVTDIRWMFGKLYVSHLGKVSTLEDTDNDGDADVLTDIVTGLPFGFHQNNGLIEDGPAHFLLAMGSATDLGPETNPLNATILRFAANGGSPTIHATGLRNVFGLARHPVNRDLFVGDNEWNLHPSLPLEGDELNRIVANGNYGYPTKFGAPATGQTFSAPVVQLPPRVAPCGVEFNPNNGLSGYAEELYMALFSTNVATIVRIPLWYGSLSGLPAGILESFATGFINPIDLLFLVDGSLLVADFSAQAIFRISPRGGAVLTVTTPPTIGTTVGVRLSAPGRSGGLGYLLASDAAAPAYPLGPGLELFINVASPVFSYAITPGNGIFNFPLPGTLNAAATVTGSIVVPNVPALIGLRIHLAGAVLDPVSLAPLATTPEQSLFFIPPF